MTCERKYAFEPCIVDSGITMYYSLPPPFCFLPWSRIVQKTPQLDVPEHPLPVPDDLPAMLNGGQSFSKIDLSQAYIQVELDEKSRRVCGYKHSPGVISVHSSTI